MLIYGVEIPEWALLGTTASVLGYWYSTRTFGYFNSKGIPGPKAYPLVGTMGSMYGQSAMESDLLYREQYGKFVGTYEGNYINLLVYDPEFIKEAFIKNFDVFTNRRIIPIGGPIDHSVLNLTDDHWKYVRSSLSPTFTQGKLKKMLPHIQQCADTFVSVTGAEKDGLVQVRERTYAYTSDVIATTAFGLETNAQTNPKSQFIHHARAIVSAFEVLETVWQKVKFTLTMSLILFAPSWFVNFLYDRFGISAFGYDTMQYFEGLVRKALKDRMETSEPGHDFVQTMADSMREVKKSDPDALKDDAGRLWSKKGLTMQEILGNAMIFILAGFQTTADTLLFTFYELAMYPELQQRLYEEIESICDTDELEIDQIQQLKFLDCCINETLRLYPVAIRFDREATKDITIQGIPIKKGSAVTVSPWVVHRDPEYWPNPLEFDPDRFLPENSVDRPSSAFLPFGLGNRACIGNRLALLEMKVAVIQTLKKYRIDKCEETISRPVKWQATASVTPERPIVVKFVARSE